VHVVRGVVGLAVDGIGAVGSIGHIQLDPSRKAFTNYVDPDTWRAGWDSNPRHRD